ncbi:GNAT family N-acetyltransferase [Streptomyces longwoodensis]|uniref:GNAT family N-acetyltransferase n=1 Tax=Streptomyces longwoodensis TaxID=68231 RepID=UPI002ED5EB42|nr:GNAT family N-acetyltransferase [Streptomyces longwoodensis]
MNVIVRDLRPGVRSDAEGFAHVRRLVLPYLLATPESVLHDLAHTHPDARMRRLVAEEDGEIIGTAQVGVAHDSPEPGVGSVNVCVHPERRHRGAGTLLARAGEEHLAAHGVRKVYSWVLDEPGHRAFAQRHGYRASRPARFLRLDLARTPLPPLPDPPAGVELRTAADFADDPRPLFQLDAECVQDEPGDVDAELGDYGAWIEEYFRHPMLDPELTSVAVADGRAVAFSVAHTDGGTHYQTAMTGTARAYRGRGLAKLAKSHSLHRARAAGYTRAYTGNDAENAPMLAINRWFGYEICATEVRHVRELP